MNFGNSNLGFRAAARVFGLLQPPLRGLACIQLRLARAVLGKLFSDIYGSDIFNRTTAFYTWWADQFGHVLIGSIFFGAISSLLVRLTRWLAEVAVRRDFDVPEALVECLTHPGPTELLLALFFWFIFYVVKEVVDAMLEDPSPAPVAADFLITDATRQELRADGWTDILFVLLGVLLWFMVSDPWVAIPLALATAVWLVPLSIAFIPGRRRLDRTGMPDFLRLHAYARDRKVTAALHDGNNSMACRPADTVAGFSEPAHGTTAVVLISAAPQITGRSALANAIGCEFNQSGAAVRFLRWRELIAEDWEEVGPTLYTAPEASFFVVDDVPFDGNGRTIEIAIEKITAKRKIPPPRVVVVLTGAGTDCEAHIAQAARALATRLGTPVRTLRVVAKVTSPTRHRHAAPGR